MQLSRRARERTAKDLYVQPYQHQEILTIDGLPSMEFEISHKDFISIHKSLICEIANDGVVMHTLYW